MQGENSETKTLAEENAVEGQAGTGHETRMQGMFKG